MPAAGGRCLTTLNNSGQIADKEIYEIQTYLLGLGRGGDLLPLNGLNLVLTSYLPNKYAILSFCDAYDHQSEVQKRSGRYRHADTYRRSTVCEMRGSPSREERKN